MDGFRSPSIRRLGAQLSSSNLLQGSISTVLELSDLLRGRQHQHQDGDLSPGHARPSNPSGLLDQLHARSRNNASSSDIAIQVLGMGNENSHSHPSTSAAGAQSMDIESLRGIAFPDSGGISRDITGAAMRSSPSVGDSQASLENRENGGQEVIIERGVNGAGEAREGGGNGGGGQRYDLQQVARWMEQGVPFVLLLFLVFIREHLQGFFITIWLIAALLKANDVIRRQAALKAERKPSVLFTLVFILVCHICAVHSLMKKQQLWRPLLLLPLSKPPAFWHAIFILAVNDVLVRFGGMCVKCSLLVAYRQSKGKTYRRQAQLLTLVEYSLLLYRALLPAPVWYSFFLNDAHGHIFSSLTTGLYLTLKLTATVNKVIMFMAAVRQVVKREVQFGSYATADEVIAAGDMCAICQEKMHSPVSLRCNHVFCEDCVSEWFERERTCPLCRAVVKAAGLRSFADGTTSLSAQIF